MLFTVQSFRLYLNLKSPGHGIGLVFQPWLLLGTPYAAGTFLFSCFSLSFLMIGLHSAQTFLKLTETCFSSASNWVIVVLFNYIHSLAG